MHAYTREGEARYFVENKSKGGLRPTTIKDARANNWLPSPTEILKTLAKPALIEWLIRNAIHAFATSPDVEGESLDDRITRVLDVEKQQDQESRAAMDLGTRIHEAIEFAINGKDWDRTLESFVCPTLAQIAIIGRVVATEKVLVNESCGYAGKTDCILDDGKQVIVLDFKTAKNIPKQPYDEALLQLSAYCAALGNTGDRPIIGAIIYISTTTAGEVKVCPSVDWKSDFERFNLILKFWQLSNSF